MEALSNKINKLTEEAEQLVSRKSALQQDLRNIEVRLTQLVGAISELQGLKKELEEPADEDVKGD